MKSQIKAKFNYFQRRIMKNLTGKKMGGWEVLEVLGIFAIALIVLAVVMQWDFTAMIVTPVKNVVNGAVTKVTGYFA